MVKFLSTEKSEASDPGFQRAMIHTTILGLSRKNWLTTGLENHDISTSQATRAAFLPSCGPVCRLLDCPSRSDILGLSGPGRRCKCPVIVQRQTGRMARRVVEWWVNETFGVAEK